MKEGIERKRQRERERKRDGRKRSCEKGYVGHVYTKRDGGER